MYGNHCLAPPMTYEARPAPARPRVVMSSNQRNVKPSFPKILLFYLRSNNVDRKGVGLPQKYLR